MSVCVCAYMTGHSWPSSKGCAGITSCQYHRPALALLLRWKNNLGSCSLCKQPAYGQAALGGGLREIAAAKAGIMKAGCPLVLARQPEAEAAAVLRATAAALGCPVRALQAAAFHTLHNITSSA